MTNKEMEEYNKKIMFETFETAEDKIHNQARQDCILAFMTGLPSVSDIDQIIVSVCKKLNPDFTGYIFIADNYYAPPNNWTKVDSVAIAKAIRQRLEFGNRTAGKGDKNDN